MKVQVHTVFFRFVYTDSWQQSTIIVHKTLFYPWALLFFLTSSLISSFPVWSLWSLSTKTLSFCHVWEWQGSRVKLTAISIQSKAGPGPRPAVPKSIYLTCCQARLLPGPVESSLVMEHVQSTGRTLWSKLRFTGRCCLYLTSVLAPAWLVQHRSVRYL